MVHIGAIDKNIHDQKLKHETLVVTSICICWSQELKLKITNFKRQLLMLKFGSIEMLLYQRH
jgi:hypothetical protein